MSQLNRRSLLAAGALGTFAYATDAALAQIGAKASSTSAPTTPPPGVKTFSSMPRTATEVAAAHLRANKESIEFLPKGEPLELSSFMAHLTRREKLETSKLTGTVNPVTRKYVLSVGIEVGESDKPNLPRLSASTILDYLEKHYVSIQARIQKDKNGNLYLHQRPVVATATFGKVRLTEDFQPAVAQSIKDMHSLGVYLPVKKPPTPENLRTVVMIHKHNGLDVTGRPEPHYEFIFIRGKQNTLGGKLDLHAFVTTEERTKLYYLKPANAPLRFSDCNIKGQVYFTRYTGGDLIPADSIVRGQKVNSQASFEMDDLNNFVRTELKLSGDALSNLNETLDAIIESKLRPKSRAIGAPRLTPTSATSPAGKK